MKAPEGVDEKYLVLMGDIFPTGWFAANLRNPRIQPVHRPSCHIQKDCSYHSEKTTLACSRSIRRYHNGFIMGHEFVGEIVEMGSAVKTLQMGDRVVTAFTTSW
jgi:hypothetical protein